MQFIIKIGINSFVACLILLNLSINPAFAQSNSDYLKLLEGEANNSSVDKKTQVKQKKETTPSPISSIDGKIPPGLSQDGFMQNLKINYIGTYFFAKRLSTSQKNEIYTFYQKNNDPQAIRTQIIKISKTN